MKYASIEEELAALKRRRADRLGIKKLDGAKEVKDVRSANELANLLLKTMDEMAASSVRKFLEENYSNVEAIARHNPVRKIHLENYIPYREGELRKSA